MKSAVKDLVSMHDTESLFEIMDENDDWMIQMDAAEGLVQLGDHRGLEFLLIAKQSDMQDVQQTAKEILAAPENLRMREQIEDQQRFASQKLVESARERLKKGRKVFLYKVIRLSPAEIVRDEVPEGGFQIYDLNDAGLEGWEAVNILPQRLLGSPGEKGSAGAYVFLRKELGPDEAGELEKR